MSPLERGGPRLTRPGVLATQDLSSMKSIKKIFCYVTILGILLFILIFFVNYKILSFASPYIYQNQNQVPVAQAVLVLGAKVKTNGSLSSILEDRAQTALELYQAKKVEKILVSGDHGTKTYDEVNALKKYFLEKGVPATDLFLDHAGFDTYDSMYRARDIFHANSLIVVTQNFHLPRAVYIGKSLGENVLGLSADKHVYVGALRMEIREVLARVKAYFSVLLYLKPKFLGPAIPLTGDSAGSWD